MVRGRWCIVVGASLMAIAHVSEARPPERQEAQLAYEVPGGVHCPDESTVHTLVAARLGYDPFVTTHVPRTIELRIRAQGGGLVGRVTIREGKTVPGVREMTSPNADCEELLASLAVTIAVGIDPLSLGSPSPPPRPSEPANAPPEAPSSLPPETDARPAPKPEPAARLEAHVGPVFAIGAAPAPSVGVVVGAGPRWRTLSLTIEGRANLPASTKSELGGEVSSSLLVGDVAPCVHVGPARGCALVAAGVLRSSGESVRAPRQDTSFYAAVGARAGAELPLGERLAIGAHADLLATLTRITLTLDDHDVWKTPPVSAAVGIDAVVLF